MSLGSFPVSSSWWQPTAFWRMQFCQLCCNGTALCNPYVDKRKAPQGLAPCLGNLATGVMGTLESSKVSLNSHLFWFLHIFPLFPEWGQKYRSWLKERPGQILHAFTEFLTFGQLIPPSENVKSWLKLAIFPVLSIKPKRLKQLWPVLSKITLTQTRSFARIAFLQSQPEGVNSTLLTQYEICKEGSKACNFVARPAKRNNLPSNITKSLGKWSETECTEHCLIGFAGEIFEPSLLLLEAMVPAKQNAPLLEKNEGADWATLSCFAVAHH